MKPADQAAWDGWLDGRADEHRYMYRWRGGDHWGDYLHGRDRGLAERDQAETTEDE